MQHFFSLLFLQKIRTHSFSCIQIIVFSLFLQNSIAQPPIGFWREHLPYQNAIQVVQGNKLYCATQYAVFSIDGDGDLERYSKVTGLNDIGINCIAWDNTTQQLIIAYNNSNIDIVKNSTVKNISDIKRSTVVGNKNINQIYCHNGIAYLSTGLGVVVIDLAKYETKDTWVIGSNGNQTNTLALTKDANFYFAATHEGLKRANLNSNNLANFSTWQSISGINGLSNGTIQNTVNCNNNIVVQKNDSLFILNGTSWSLFYFENNWQIENIQSSENKIFVAQRSTSGASRILQLNTAGTIEKNIAQAGIISFPKNAIGVNGVIWIADFFGGLSKYTNTFQQYIPNGTLGLASGSLVFNNNILYAAAGSVNDAWNYLYNRDGVFIYKDGSWTYEGYFNKPILDSVLDFISLAADKRDKSLWAGSYGGGLVHFKDNNIRIYKNNNSTLQAAIGDANSYRISGLAFDANNNLWLANYAAPQNLQVRKADGTFKAFTIPFAHFENAISQLVVDDANQVWAVSPRGNGVFCYNYGNNIDALNDDQWKYLRAGLGQGNLPSNNVYCLAKDKNGFIWIGTDKGVAVIQCATEIFTQPCDAVKPIVQQGAFAGFLFQDQEVQCIAVDGANRKWIGTKKGLWLVNADGDKIIYQFTEDNSPLLSNDVKQLAINPTTGEVFVATFKGICSFRSTATEGRETNSNVLIFPNPVPPNFSGTIAIKGLVNNANVKIVEPNGRLVFETRALGGQAVWNGKNYKGEKVASGVYLVFVKDDTGIEKTVTKIFILSGK
jgi:ligand-binding sensor domain-containing protein